MHVHVRLTHAEFIQSANAGVLRMAEHRKLNELGIATKHKYGMSTDDEWTSLIEGTQAECALAKALGVYWSGKGEMGGADVGDDYVRQTHHHHGCLILHDEDKDDRRHYLLTGRNGDFIIRGWAWGYEGKQKQFWRDPAGGRPAYFVPQSALHPFQVLVEGTA